MRSCPVHLRTLAYNVNTGKLACPRNLDGKGECERDTKPVVTDAMREDFARLGITEDESDALR